MPETLDMATRRTVGVRDIPLALLAPGKLFARVEDVATYKWSLLILLTAVTLIGYATVQTGLISREVDRRVGQRIARIESQQRDIVERSALRKMYEKEYKKGAFEQLLARIQVIVAEPAKALAAVLLVAAGLYGVVALTGKKPEWHTLLCICVYAGFIDLLRLLVRLGLMLHFRTLEVDTSLSLLAPLLAGSEGVDPKALAALAGGLSALDPFRLWFWLVVIVGLKATAQLRGWRAWVTCTICWLVAAGGRAGLALALLAGGAGEAAANT